MLVNDKIRIFKFNNNNLRCVFQSNNLTKPDNIIFIDNNTIAVVFNKYSWIELLKIEKNLPSITAVDLTAEVTCIY